MRVIIVAVIILITLLISAWYFSVNIPESEESISDTAYLIGEQSFTLNMATWEWIKTAYNNDTELVPNQAGAFTLTFNNDGTFFGTTDCNSMSGGYIVDDNSLTFSDDIMMTLRYCEETQESDFMLMLQQVQLFHFTNRGELVFDLKFDSGSSIFR